LARLLARLMPDEAEAHGLLALLALTDARRPARLNAGGGLVARRSRAGPGRLTAVGAPA
jgi:predicted RNA polymerase sigma factor